MTHASEELPPGLLLSDDLIFASQITGTARAIGRVLRQSRSIDALLDIAAKQAPRCVLLDLAFPGLALADFMSRLRATCSDMPRVVAYGSHVDAAGLRAAREAGCDPVLPRSKFVEVLPLSLESWLEGS